MKSTSNIIKQKDRNLIKQRLHLISIINQVKYQKERKLSSRFALPKSLGVFAWAIGIHYGMFKNMKINNQLRDNVYARTTNKKCVNYVKDRILLLAKISKLVNKLRKSKKAKLVNKLEMNMSLLWSLSCKYGEDKVKLVQRKMEEYSSEKIEERLFSYDGTKSGTDLNIFTYKFVKPVKPNIRKEIVDTISFAGLNKSKSSTSLETIEKLSKNLSLIQHKISSLRSHLKAINENANQTRYSCYDNWKTRQSDHSMSLLMINGSENSDRGENFVKICESKFPSYEPHSTIDDIEWNLNIAEFQMVDLLLQIKRGENSYNEYEKKIVSCADQYEDITRKYSFISSKETKNKLKIKKVPKQCCIRKRPVRFIPRLCNKNISKETHHMNNAFNKEICYVHPNIIHNRYTIKYKVIKYWPVLTIFSYLLCLLSITDKRSSLLWHGYNHNYAQLYLTCTDYCANHNYILQTRNFPFKHITLDKLITDQNLSAIIPPVLLERSELKKYSIAKRLQILWHIKITFIYDLFQKRTESTLTCYLSTLLENFQNRTTGKHILTKTVNTEGSIFCKFQIEEDDARNVIHLNQHLILDWSNLVKWLVGKTLNVNESTFNVIRKNTGTKLIKHNKKITLKSNAIKSLSNFDSALREGVSNKLSTENCTEEPNVNNVSALIKLIEKREKEQSVNRADLDYENTSGFQRSIDLSKEFEKYSAEDGNERGPIAKYKEQRRSNGSDTIFKRRVSIRNKEENNVPLNNTIDLGDQFEKVVQEIDSLRLKFDHINEQLNVTSKRNETEIANIYDYIHSLQSKSSTGTNSDEKSNFCEIEHTTTTNIVFNEETKRNYLDKRLLKEFRYLKCAMETRFSSNEYDQNNIRFLKKVIDVELRLESFIKIYHRRLLCLFKSKGSLKKCLDVKLYRTFKKIESRSKRFLFEIAHLRKSINSQDSINEGFSINVKTVKSEKERQENIGIELTEKIGDVQNRLHETKLMVQNGFATIESRLDRLENKATCFQIDQQEMHHEIKAIKFNTSKNEEEILDTKAYVKILRESVSSCKHTIQMLVKEMEILKWKLDLEVETQNKINQNVDKSLESFNSRILQLRSHDIGEEDLKKLVTIIKWHAKMNETSCSDLKKLSNRLDTTITFAETEIDALITNFVPNFNSTQINSYLTQETVCELSQTLVPDSQPVKTCSEQLTSFCYESSESDNSSL